MSNSSGKGKEVLLPFFAISSVNIQVFEQRQISSSFKL